MSPATQLSSLTMALGFLTRVPVPAGSPSGSAFRWVLFWFPFVGGLVGGVLTTTHWLFAKQASEGLAAACTVAASVWLTGALHLDGVADTADGWSAAHGDVTRGLDVMRDSRIGAHGAVALIVLLLLQFTAISHLSTRGAALSSLIVAPLAARYFTGIALLWFPAARATGIAAKFRRSASWGPTLGGALWLLLVFSLLTHTLDTPWLALALGVIASALTVFCIGWAATRSFGGLTGDVCGAMIEWSQLGCWLVGGLLA